jgi:lysophospholipase L1-like esterase
LLMAVARCGVEQHQQGFAAQIAAEYADAGQCEVRWQVVGQYGATARRIRYRLVPQLRTGLDAALVLAGANDVLAGRERDLWQADLGGIIELLTSRARRVVIIGLPPFGSFPALPRPLRGLLAERATALDAAARDTCHRHPRAVWVAATALSRTEIGPDFFASDRFHPSAVGYARWARDVARQLPDLVC